MTLELGAALTSLHHWAIVGATALTAAIVVGLHYEVLQQLNRRMPRWRLPRHPRVLVLIFCLLATHFAEIWLFGFTIYALAHVPGTGGIVGVDPLLLLDAMYLSGTTYSTLGYGDLVPVGPIRFLFGIESIVGLMMLAWSASFTYFEMARYWKGDN
jgi:hypothetical protein